MLQTVNGKKIAERFERMRRFSTADLNEHGGWILQRMLQVYPHLHEHTIAGYLRSMVDSNEHLFLNQPNSVALVQLDRGFTLEPESVVRERYVLARDPDNPEAHSRPTGQRSRLQRRGIRDRCFDRQSADCVADWFHAG